MNFFKKLFKSEAATSDITSIIIENVESRLFTEVETAEQIERFVSYKETFVGFDSLLEDAAKLIVQKQVGLSSILQREMKLGYNRAGTLMKQLILIGIIKPNSPSLPSVLLKTEVELEQFFKNQFLEIENIYNNHKIEIVNRIKENQHQANQHQAEVDKNKIKQELIERERKKQVQREVYKELQDDGIIKNQSIDKEWRREPIPQDVMDKVWNRDGGKCVKCGSKESLEFDHIIPFSKGGANTYRNLQILCKRCNIEKFNNIG